MNEIYADPRLEPLTTRTSAHIKNSKAYAHNGDKTETEIEA